MPYSPNPGSQAAFFRSSFKVLLACASAAALSVTAAKAQEDELNVVCPPTDTRPNLGVVATAEAYCAGTPEKYQLIIYEMGLCTSNPTSSNVLDRSSCTPTFKSEGGTTVNLAGGAVIDLGSSEESDLGRPEDNSYSYAYIIISNRFVLKAKWGNTDGTTYYSNPDGLNNVSLSPPALDFVEDLSSFDEGFDPVYPPIIVRGGTLAALLLKPDLTPASNGLEVGRLVGTFKPQSSLVIDEAVKGLKVELTVSNSGLTVGVGENTGDFNGPPSDPRAFNCYQQPCSYGSGPFQPTFTLIK
jgi:hypothetical protein